MFADLFKNRNSYTIIQLNNNSHKVLINLKMKYLAFFGSLLCSQLVDKVVLTSYTSTMDLLYMYSSNILYSGLQTMPKQMIKNHVLLQAVMKQTPKAIISN